MRIASLSVACAGLALVASLALAHPPGHQARQAKAAAATQPQPQSQPQAQAEPPGPAGRNLQVLPADIPQGRLFMIMRQWSQALGVECSYCHVRGDFKSDANPHKNVARGMVRMTNQINNDLLPPVVGSSQQPRVNCYACHRGEPIPDTQLPAPGAAPAAPQGPQPERRPPEDAPPAHIAPDTPARPY